MLISNQAYKINVDDSRLKIQERLFKLSSVIKLWKINLFLSFNISFKKIDLLYIYIYIYLFIYPSQILMNLEYFILNSVNKKRMNHCLRIPL
jgi:hypothetical protein